MISTNREAEMTCQDMIDAIQAHVVEISAALPKLKPFHLEDLLADVAELSGSVEAWVVSDILAHFENSSSGKWSREEIKAGP